jgi:hypothetical protein
VKLLLAVIVMGAVEDEGTFWIQLLMIVTLAAGAGAYVLIKSRVKRVERQTHDETIETIIAHPKPLVTGHAFPERPAVSEIKPRRRDLSGGMELLARNFLVSVVERTDSPDQRDIEMRRLCFTELGRRVELWAIASTALKVYTLDEDGFYGKTIRCEAMAELAGRTTDKPRNTAETPPVLLKNQERAESAAHHTG